MNRRLAVVAVALSLIPGLTGAQTDLGNDFTPGTKVLLADDFTRVPLGMFPRNLRLVEGNLEVAKIDGNVRLRASSFPTTFTIPLAATLPERFTLEFDYSGAGWKDEVWLVTPETEGFEVVFFEPTGGGIRGPARRIESSNGLTSDSSVMHHVAVMADGNYVKVYSNGVRVANAPNAVLGRSKAVTFRLYAEAEAPGFIANLRLAAGGKDLYRALMEEGRMTLEGIEFDTGSDKLRPVSDTVLKAVADALLKAPTLNVGVEGHTDNVGSDESNMALSERRAGAVKARLEALGVAPGRLTARGFGASQPIASNETPEERQRNRRVELTREN